MLTVREFTNIVGREKIIASLAVSESALSNALSGDSFPASWYQILKALGEEHEIAQESISHLFRWKNIRVKKAS